MLTFIGLFGLMGGTYLASAADRFADRQAVLERCSGTMLIAGLSAVGVALPLFR